VAGPAQGPRPPRPREPRRRLIARRLAGSRRLQRPVVEALESRMLLSASKPLTTLIKLPAVIVLVATHKPVAAQTDPAVEPVNQVPQNGTARQVKPLQSAGHGVTGSAGATPTVVNIVPAPTPSISLKYSSNGIVSSSSPVLVSTPVSLTTGPAQGPTPQKPGAANEGPEQSELTPQGMQQLPALPRRDEVEVSGTLQPAQTWMTYRIPVGSSTQSLEVTVSQLGPQGEPAIPALDQLYLVGPSDVVLTMLKGASAYAQGPQQDMMILLSAVPDNSELLLRIVETPAPSLAAGPPQTLPASLNIPFTMDVQRTDLATGALPLNAVFQTVAPVGLAGPLLIAYGNVAVTVSPPSLGSSGVAPDTEAASSELTGMEPSAVAIAAAGARLTTQVEVATPGASVGPLVSRGSAPLRPLVGTIPGEPTPSIDRNERAFDLAALGSGAGLDAELLLGLTTNRSDGNGEDTPVDQATRTSGPLIALRAPGGLPVMVSSVRGQSLIDPAAVLATLAAPESLPDPGQQLARLPALPPLEASGALRHGDAVACTDFLKAACGLMLGIGLTTGPFYPDLMALVRNFLPRRTPLANSPRRSRARRKGPLRSLCRWLWPS
jgi:hypothetical protein